MSEDTKSSLTTQRMWLALFALVTLMILLGCYWFLRSETERISQKKFEELSTIGKLKVDEIALWRKERLSDANRSSRNRFFVNAVTAYISNPATPGLLAELRERLELERDTGDYNDVLLLTPNGGLLVSAQNEPDSVGSTTKRAVAEAIARRQAIISDVYHDPDGNAQVDTVAAMWDTDGRPVALLILISHARDFLYPLINSWPTLSRSAETLLVMRRGDEVVFLNDIRLRAKSALTFRIPLTRTEVPAVQAVLGRQGIFIGHDYRGVKVLSYLHAVPESPWVMVAKVDSDELLAEIYNHYWIIGLLVVLLILLAAAVIVFAYRRQREAMLYLNLYRAEQKQQDAERLLVKTQRNTELILNAVGEGIYGLDIEGKGIFVNPQAARMLGYEPGELLGQVQHEVIHHTRANGTPYPKEECPIYAAIKQNLTRSVDDEVFWRKDGSNFPVEYTSTPVINEDGRPSGAVVVFRDISERRRVEQELIQYREHLEDLVRDRTAELSKLAQAIKQSPVSVVITDCDGTIEYVNPKFTEVTGYTEQEALGQNPRILNSGEQSKEFYQTMWEMLTTGTTWVGDLHNRRKDGQLYWEHASISPLRNSEGAITHYVAVKEDITQRRLMEEALMKAKIAAEEANLAKSTFVANMSHEIRTPMNAILGFAQVLEHDSTLTARQAEHVQTIIRSGEHLLRLINDILDMSRIEAGHITFNKGTFCLNDLLEDLEMMFRSRTDAKGLKFIVERDESLPPYVTADEGKLRQVLINLLGNAVKFTETGGISLRIRTEAASGEAVEGTDALRMEVEVEDSGPGISDGDLELIFDAFQQTKAGMKAGGTGLGLAISRKLVEMMGGKLTVTSQVGRGSCFRFQVLLEPAEDVGRHKKPASRRVVGLEPGAGPIRILVVDDTLDNRTLLYELLRPLGIEVGVACNGVEAIEIFEKWSPHAVLMDMRMPIMDGYEATRRIKATVAGQNTPVIAVTASVFEDDEAQVMAVGIDGFVRKPFRPEEILEALGKCLELRYVYADEIDKDRGHAKPHPVIRESLAALPKELVREMREAVAEGDMARLAELIGQAGKLDSDAARTLQALADRYEYKQLNQWLEEGGIGNG